MFDILCPCFAIPFKLDSKALEIQMGPVKLSPRGLHNKEKQVLRVPALFTFKCRSCGASGIEPTPLDCLRLGWFYGTGSLSWSGKMNVHAHIACHFTSLLFTSSFHTIFFLPYFLFSLSLFFLLYIFPISSDSLYPLFHILSNSGKPWCKFYTDYILWLTSVNLNSFNRIELIIFLL